MMWIRGKAARRLLLAGWAIKIGSISWRSAATLMVSLLLCVPLPDLVLNAFGAFTGQSVRSAHEGSAWGGAWPYTAIHALIHAWNEAGPKRGTLAAGALALLPIMMLFMLAMAMMYKNARQATRIWGAGEALHEKMRDGERRALLDREELEGVTPQARSGVRAEGGLKKGRGWL